MKKLTKILALMLAGLLCTSALLACQDSYVGDDDDEEEEEEMDFSDYEKLAPEEVWASLEDAQMARITITDYDDDVTIITKSGQKVKIDDDGDIEYYDYQNQLTYALNEDGTYTVNEDSDNWEDMLESISRFFSNRAMEFLFEDDWYEKSGSLYSATIETLENLDLDCDSCSAYMETSKTTYTFVFEISKDGQNATIKCQIEFKEFTVKLPEVEDNNTVTNTPTTKPLPGNTTQPSVSDTPVTQAPPVTEAPPVTAVPPVTEAPETPEKPIYAKTPYQLFNETVNATDATVRVKYKGDDGLTYQYTFEKDGEIILWSETNSGIDYYYNYYYDNVNGYQYYLESDGNWYYIPDYLDWYNLLSSVSNVMEGILTMDDGCFEYDADQDCVKLSKAYCDKLGIRGASVSLNSYGNQYTFSIIYNDFSASSFSVQFSVFDVKLPANAQPGEPAEEETYLAPSELYNALMNSEDVYFEVFNGSQYAIYQKDGSIVSTSVGTSLDNMSTVYVDTQSGIGYYYANGQWLSTPYEATWESMMAQAGMSATTYLFVDSYFNVFDEYDQKLTIREDLMSDPGAVIELIRNEKGYTYNISNKTTDTYFYLSFAPLTIELPA